MRKRTRRALHRRYGRFFGRPKRTFDAWRGQVSGGLAAIPKDWYRPATEVELRALFDANLTPHAAARRIARGLR